MVRDERLRHHASQAQGVFFFFLIFYSTLETTSMLQNGYSSDSDRGLKHDARIFFCSFLFVFTYTNNNQGRIYLWIDSD